MPNAGEESFEGYRCPLFSLDVRKVIDPNLNVHQKEKARGVGPFLFGSLCGENLLDFFRG